MPTPRQHEIHFAPLPVPSGAHQGFWEVHLQMFEDHVLPQQPAVLGPERLPPSHPAHKTGFKCVHLRLPDILALTTARTASRSCQRALRLGLPDAKFDSVCD